MGAFLCQPRVRLVPVASERSTGAAFAGGFSNPGQAVPKLMFGCVPLALPDRKHDVWLRRKLNARVGAHHAAPDGDALVQVR